MIQIRKNVFETNSSSMHALIVGEDCSRTINDIDNDIIEVKGDYDFSRRIFVNRYTYKEKLSIFFHAMFYFYVYKSKYCNMKKDNDFKDEKISQAYYNNPEALKKYTDQIIDEFNDFKKKTEKFFSIKITQFFNDFLNEKQQVIKSFIDGSGIRLKFSDESFKIDNDLSAIDFDFVFGHKVLQNMDIIFKWCFDTDKNDGSKYTSYDFFSDEIEFIRSLYDYTDDSIKSRNWFEWVQVFKWCFGKNSTFLQYTDEGDDDSNLLFRNTIKEYCKKSKYMVDLKIFS